MDVYEGDCGCGGGGSPGPAAESRRGAEGQKRRRRGGGPGPESLEAARQRAAEELRTLNEKADGRIQAAAQALLRETEAQKDRLRTQGESRLDQAARQIAERIVNG